MSATPPRDDGPDDRDRDRPRGPGYGPSGSYRPGYGQPGQGPSGPWQQPGGYVPPPPMSPADQRLWATLVHVGGVFFQVVVPVVGYLVLRDRGPFVREHARVALNFHLTMLIAYAASGFLTVIGIGFLLLPAIWVLSLVLAVVAAVRASSGEFFTYPLSIEFVRR